VGQNRKFFKFGFLLLRYSRYALLEASRSKEVDIGGIKMDNQKIAKAVSLFLVFCLVLSSLGCIGQEEEPAVLSVSMSLTEEEWKVMREDIFPQFEEEHNCTIEAYEVAAADLPRKLESMVEAGKMEIDIFAQDNMQLAILVEEGLVEDLSNYERNIPGEVIDALIEAGRFEGKLYFMPYRPNVQITYYNEARFNEYGLSPPTDWDELLEVAKAFEEEEGVGRVLIKAAGGAPTTAQMYEFIVSAGGDPLEFNDAGCVETFEFLQELWPYLSPDSKTAKWDTTNTYMAQESAYLGQNWPFGVPIIVKDYGKTEVKTYHGFSGPVKEAHVIGGEVLGIPTGSPHKELALDFIEYMQSKEVQEILASKLAWPSIRTDATGRVEDWLKPYYESILEAMEYGIFRANVPYWTEFDKLFNDAFEEIVINGEPVEETLDRYHEEMERVKEEYEG
jgi:trehalose transport system substrate-binding protein